jgi:hypothetical protein
MRKPSIAENQSAEGIMSNSAVVSAPKRIRLACIATIAGAVTGTGRPRIIRVLLSRCGLQQRLFALRLREMRNGNRDQSAVPPPRDRARDALRFPEGQNLSRFSGFAASH